MTGIPAELAGGRMTVDLSALVANWMHLRKLCDGRCGAVVKANAYGCDINTVVPALADAGCDTFFVALPEEGVRARKSAPTATIYVLNGLFAEAAPFLIANDLIPVLGSTHEVTWWQAAARDHGSALPCALQVDSGMNRLGLSLRELERTVKTDLPEGLLDVRLFMTHFACADDIGHPKTDLQREVFEQAAQLLPNVPKSAANSAAILQASGLTYDLARPGIALYGGEALNDTPNPMQPVVTLEGRIITIRDVKAGDSVGYGAAETVTRNTRLAYISMGYADGYHRAASQSGVPMRHVAPAARAAFDGQLIKGVGRVSMDLMAFDVTDLGDRVRPGDWLELFGNTIPVDDVARAAGTIGYEMLTALGSRHERRIVG